MKFVVIIPCSKDSDSLPNILAKIPRRVSRIGQAYTIVIDNATSDVSNTAKNLRVDKIVKLRRSRSESELFSLAIQKALAVNGTVTIILNPAGFSIAEDEIRDLLISTARLKRSISLATTSRIESLLQWLRFKYTKRVGVDSLLWQRRVFSIPSSELKVFSKEKEFAKSYSLNKRTLFADKSALSQANKNTLLVRDTTSHTLKDTALLLIAVLMNRVRKLLTQFVSVSQQQKVTFALFLSIFVLFTVTFTLRPVIPSTPEENIREYYLSRIKSQGLDGLAYQESANEKFNTELIKPRNTVVNSQGQVVPSDFLGIYVYAYPLLKMGFNERTIQYILPLLALISTFGVYRLARKIFNRKSGQIAAMLLSVFPAYLYWQGHIMTDIPSMGFISLGLSYYIDCIRVKNYRFILLCGLLIGIGVAFKYTNVLFAAIFLTVYFPYRKMLNSGTLWTHTLLGLSILLPIVPILFLNQELYGGFLTTGQALYSGGSSILRTADVNLLQSFVKYFVNFYGVIFLLAVLAVGHLIRINSKRRMRFIVYALLFSSISFYYFARAADVYGATDSDALLTYSQPRYYLPIFAVIIIIASYFLGILIKRSKLNVSLVILLTIVSLLCGLEYKGTGIIAAYNDGKYNQKVRQNILASTEKNSYIYTAVSDKYLFPARKTVTYYNAGKDELNVRIKNSIQLANHLLADNNKVYFLWETVAPRVARERGYGTFDDYSKAMALARITLVPKGDGLYQLQREQR